MLSSHCFLPLLLHHQECQLTCSSSHHISPPSPWVPTHLPFLSPHFSSITMSANSPALPLTTLLLHHHECQLTCPSSYHIAPPSSWVPTHQPFLSPHSQNTVASVVPLLPWGFVLVLVSAEPIHRSGVLSTIHRGSFSSTTSQMTLFDLCRWFLWYNSQLHREIIIISQKDFTCQN